MSSLTLETNKNKQEEIDILEDDEFEEFEKEDWNENEEEPEDTKEWEEDWDEDVDDDFTKQLREELKTNNMME
eukprot:gene5151-8757_t